MHRSTVYNDRREHDSTLIDSSPSSVIPIGQAVTLSLFSGSSYRAPFWFTLIRDGLLWSDFCMFWVLPW